MDGLQLSRFVLRISHQADTCKKEDRSQYTIHNNALYVSGTVPAIHKADRSQNEAEYAHNGQNNAQYPFFHIIRF